ncbi:hypothetical protein HanIR_Chr14g0700701 [Helianthus annuus]|nr:hypothetical protein HanIR_Chr14g0700701 [Helianthus annuus]
MSAHMWHNSKSRIGEAYFVRFIFSLILSLTQPITPKTLIPKSGAPSILQSLLRRSSRVSSRNRIVSSNLIPIDRFKVRLISYLTLFNRFTPSNLFRVAHLGFLPQIALSHSIIDIFKVRLISI